MVLSDWTDEASFRQFEHSADHATNRSDLQPFRLGGSMMTMDVVRRLAVPEVRS